MNWFLKTLHTYVKLPTQIESKLDEDDKELIRRAAELASGTNDVPQWGGNARSGVMPILSLIGDRQDANEYLPCKAMNLDSFSFGDWTYDSTLWDSFIEELNTLRNTVLDDILFEESLVYTCQKYLSCISINDATKDISLYHHIKMTAAIATCLKDNENEVVLAGADFSGIQPFIYNLVSKNAAKNLKGRSFYLQLLIDSVIQKLSKDLNLGGWQMVYASGGKFYMLIPAGKEDDFKKLGKDIAEEIRKTHRLQIYLAIGTLKIELDKGEPIGENMSNVWKDLSEELSRQKRRRFADKLVDDFDEYFKDEGIEVGGENTRDVITNEEFTEAEQDLHNKNVKANDEISQSYQRSVRYLGDMEEKPDVALTQHIKASTFKQIELGKDLREAKYWVSWQAIAKKDIEKDIFQPCKLGVYHVFCRNLTEVKTVIKGKNDCRIFKFNELNITDELKSDKVNATIGHTFYGGNEFPGINQHDLDQLTEKEKAENDYKIGDPRTFSMLASTRDPKRLGILRMDVDNLGQHFINGIAAAKRNFSRYLALSNSLDYFFQGYLNTIWNKDEYREDTMIIYSGGDDLFIIGRWDKAIEIADKIQSKFREYVCGNLGVTLSGGVFLSPPKYPVMNGAKIAGDAEKAAKEYTSKNGEEKDAFAFLGNAMGWTKEYKFVKECKDKFVEWHEKLGDKFPNGLLQRIIGYAQSEKRYDEEKAKGNKPSPRWTWLMMYDLTKMAQRTKDDDFKKMIFEIRDTAYIKDKTKYNQSNLQLYAIAARWAELYVRNKN